MISPIYFCWNTSQIGSNSWKTFILKTKTSCGRVEETGACVLTAHISQNIKQHFLYLVLNATGHVLYRWRFQVRQRKQTVWKWIIHSWWNFNRTMFTIVRQLAGSVYLRNLWHSVGVESAAVALVFHLLYSDFITIILSSIVCCSEGKSWANTFNQVASLELPSRLFSLAVPENIPFHSL